jgi:hypothetical protein
LSEEAGAAGAEGAEEEVDAAPEEEDAALSPDPDPDPELDPDDASAPPSFLDSFFDEPYRSEYHPLPLRTKEVRLITFSSGPLAPQPGHDSGAGSFIFWRTSVSLPHCLQTYS